MTATRIRPVSDLRNRYPDIEAGKGVSARKALADIRKKYNV